VAALVRRKMTVVNLMQDVNCIQRGLLFVTTVSSLLITTLWYQVVDKSPNAPLLLWRYNTGEYCRYRH